MFRAPFVTATLLVALSCLAAAQTSYHVDAVQGDDLAGDGSAGAPWASLGRLQGVTLVPGDRVRLARGSVFRERLTIGDSGSSSDPIVIEAYGVGDAPLVSAGELVPAGSAWVGPDLAGEYTLDVGSTLEFYTADAVLVRATGAGPASYVLLARGTGGSLAPDTYEARASAGRRVLHVKPPAGASPADFDYELSKRNYAVLLAGDHVELRGVDAILANGGHPTLDAPITPSVVVATGASCAIRASRAAYGRGFGVALQGPDSVIDGCVAEHNHSTGLYVLGAGADRARVEGCIVRHNGNLEWLDLDRGGIGVQADDAVVRGNHVEANGNPADDVPPRVGGDAAISLFDCARATVEDNFIVDSTRGAVDMSYTPATFGHRIVGNVILRWNLLGEESTLKTQAITLLGFGDTPDSGSGEVSHNTLHSDQVDAYLIGIQVGLPANADTIQGARITNNVVSLPDNTNPGSVGLRLVRGHRFYGTTIDHNDVYLPLQPANAYSWSDAGGVFAFADAASLAAHAVFCDADPRCEATPGHQAHGAEAPPGFVSAAPSAAADFDLGASSALVDAGADVGRASDFLGRPVPAGAAPDVGAFELQLDPLAALAQLVADAVALLEAADPPGVQGLLKKLDGNGGVLRKVLTAAEAYAAGELDALEYVEALENALGKLGAFENQLAGKAAAGQVVEPELSALEDLSAEIRAAIEALIASA